MHVAKGDCKDSHHLAPRAPQADAAVLAIPWRAVGGRRRKRWLPWGRLLTCLLHPCFRNFEVATATLNLSLVRLCSSSRAQIVRMFAWLRTSIGTEYSYSSVEAICLSYAQPTCVQFCFTAVIEQRFSSCANTTVMKSRVPRCFSYSLSSLCCCPDPHSTRGC